MSCHALFPGGFLNVEPPVFSRIGCAGFARLGDAVHLGQDRRLIAGAAPEQGLRKNHVRRGAGMAVGEAHVGVAEHADVSGPVDPRPASISTSVVSPPCAPAFMRSAPPIEPGMPR